jgi:hypothetical protein
MVSDGQGPRCGAMTHSNSSTRCVVMLFGREGYKRVIAFFELGKLRHFDFVIPLINCNRSPRLSDSKLAVIKADLCVWVRAIGKFREWSKT